jgi:hypothetical protein
MGSIYLDGESVLNDRFDVSPSVTYRLGISI